MADNIQNKSDTLGNILEVHSQKLNLTTQQSMESGSGRKRFYVKKFKLSECQNIPKTAKNSNIFDLTNLTNTTHSQINDTYNSMTESRIFNNSLSVTTIKQIETQNPQQKILPTIIQSKYNFKPSIALPKIKRKISHIKDPKYLQDLVSRDQNNMKKMKKYKQIWESSSLMRNHQSLLDRSVQKAQKTLQKYNSQVLEKKKSLNFQKMLRDRHKYEEYSFGTIKGIPKRSIPGLKGKGGSVKSLFEEIYTIEQVYKAHK